MPGPGGGSHGGGGHGGHHSSSTSHHGRNHGGMHYHRPHYGGYYHRPMFYGGGCFSGLIGMFIYPIIFVIFILIFISSLVGTSFKEIIHGGYVRYDENTFQDYADKMYKQEFSTSTAYEDNILLLLLVDTKEYNEYYYIAWVGDHIKTDINYMFGNENTILGSTLNNYINTNSYKYSFDSNIADVIKTMSNEIKELELETSFNCEEEHTQVKSHFINYSSLDLTASTIDSALTEFTDTTGIPIVLVVNEITEVFPKTNSWQSIFIIFIFIFVIGLIIYNIINKKKDKTYKNNTNNRYYDCDDWEEN